MSPKQRRSDKHLPSRVYRKHGSYYFVDRDNKWHNLGKTPAEMAIEWAKLFTVSDSNYRTMGDVFNRYESEVIPSKAEATQKTNHREMAVIRSSFGHMNPNEITPVDIYQFLDKRGKVAPTRANREKALLSHAFSMAIKWGIVTDNPCRNVKRLREEARDRYVTNDEYKAVWKIAPPLLKNMMDVAYLTGLRITDILKIRHCDITKEGIFVVISKVEKKVKRKHLYELTEDLIAVLNRIPRRGLFLFSRKSDTGQFTAERVSRLWNRLIKKCLKDGAISQPFQFRDIRAKAGTDAEKLGGREYARHLLGHTSQQMTDTYIRGVMKVKGLKLLSNTQ